MSSEPEGLNIDTGSMGKVVIDQMRAVFGSLIGQLWDSIAGWSEWIGLAGVLFVVGLLVFLHGKATSGARGHL